MYRGAAQLEDDPLYLPAGQMGYGWWDDAWKETKRVAKKVQSSDTVRGLEGLGIMQIRYIMEERETRTVRIVNVCHCCQVIWSRESTRQQKHSGIDFVCGWSRVHNAVCGTVRHCVKQCTQGATVSSLDR